MLMKLCIYLETCLFKIHVNRFMAWDDSPGADVISKGMLWVRGFGATLSFETSPFSN